MRSFIRMGNCCTSQETYPPADILALYNQCTDDNTPFVCYENIKQMVKILRVVDGDTVDIAMADEHKKINKYRIRLYGIDTPEKKPLKSNPDREREMEAAKAASQAMREKLEENQNYITVQLYKPDKYGRLLGTFYDRMGKDINQWMILTGHATEYFGKTKMAFSEVCPKGSMERDHKK